MTDTSDYDIIGALANWLRRDNLPWHDAADAVEALKTRAEEAEAENKRLGEALLTGADVEAMLKARAEATKKRITELTWQVNNMRTRAEGAEQERDRLRDKLAKCHGDRMVVDQRVKELESLMSGRASTILLAAKL